MSAFRNGFSAPETARRFVDRLDAILNLPRIRVYAVAFGTIYVAVLLWAIYFDSLTIIGGEFSVYYSGGYMVLHDDVAQIYDPVQHNAALQEVVGPGKEDLVYLWLLPPFVAYLYVPFNILPFSIMRFPYIAGVAVTLAYTIRLLWLHLPRLQRRASLSTVLVISFSVAPVITMIAGGQTSAFSLALYAGGLILLSRHRDVGAGALLGLGVFKPQLFVLVPILLLLCRRWRALTAWLGVASALTIASVGVVGIEGIRDFQDLVRSDLYTQALIDESAGKMLSIPALVHYLYPLDTLPSIATSLASIGAVLIGCGVLGLATRGISVERRTSKEFLTLAFGLVVVLVVLTTSHFFDYDGTLLVLPALVLLDRRPSQALKFTLIVGFLLLNTMFLRRIILGEMGYPWYALGAPWVQLAVLPMAYWLYIELRSFSAQQSSPVQLHGHSSSDQLSGRRAS